MAQTVLSAATPYCTPAQLVQFHDWRPLARLVADSDTAPQETLSAFLADPNAAALLQAASGEVEAACLRSDRYAPADLQALQSPVLTNSGLLLARLVADLFVVAAYQRRGLGLPESGQAIWDRAQAMLLALERGDEIFGLQETADAGVSTDVLLTNDDMIQNNGIVAQAEPFFGLRANWYWGVGRGGAGAAWWGW